MRVHLSPVIVTRHCSPNPAASTSTVRGVGTDPGFCTRLPQRFHNKGPEIFSFRVVTSKQVCPGHARGRLQTGRCRKAGDLSG